MTEGLDFLGRGWAFPPSAAGDGTPALLSGEQLVAQSIRLILETEPGERVMRPDFGCGLRAMLFEPLGTGTLAVMRHRVEQALVAWEPRIDVREVEVTADGREHGRVDVRVAYTIRATNSFYNLVFPFYLQEART